MSCTRMPTTLADCWKLFLDEIQASDPTITEEVAFGGKFTFYAGFAACLAVVNAVVNESVTQGPGVAQWRLGLLRDELATFRREVERRANDGQHAKN